MDTKIKSLIFLIFLILFSNSSSKKLSYMLKSQGSKISRGVVDMLLGLASAIFGGNSSELNKCLPANARNSRWAKDTFTKDSLTKFGETNKYLNIVITGIKVISKIACFLRKNYNKIAKLFGKGPKVIAFIQSYNGNQWGWFNRVFHKATNWARKKAEAAKRKLARARAWARKKAEAAKRKLARARAWARRKAAKARAWARRKAAQARRKLAQARARIRRRIAQARARARAWARRKMAQAKALARRAKAKALRAARIARDKIRRARALARKLKARAIALARTKAVGVRNRIRRARALAIKAARRARAKLVKYRNWVKAKAKKAKKLAISAAKKAVRLSRKYYISAGHLATRAYYKTRNDYLKAKNFAKKSWRNIKKVANDVSKYTKKGWAWMKQNAILIFNGFKGLLKRIALYWVKVYSNIVSFFNSTKFKKVMWIIKICGVGLYKLGSNLKGIYSAFKVIKNGGITPYSILIGVLCNIFNLVKLVDFIIDLVKNKPPSREFQIGKVLGQFLLTALKIIGAGSSNKKTSLPVG